jgi:hypothetical protein
MRDAMGEGFTLEPKGDGHYTLVKGTERIPVPSTPKNPDGTAKRIRAQMRQTRSRQVVRCREHRRRSPMTTLRPFTEQEYQEYEMSRLFISERHRKRTL